MNLSDAQIEKIYNQLVFQLKLRIVGQFGSMQKFADEAKINRTTLVKIFSENIEQDMSVGMYYRIVIGLGLASGEGINPAVLDSKVRVKEYLMINNNFVMNSINIISMDL